MSLKSLMSLVDGKQVALPILKKYLLNRKDRHEAVIDDAKLTIACFKERIAEYNHGKDIEGEFFHPSAIGMCLRNLWFSSKKAPADLTTTADDALKSHITFEIGTYSHVLFQNLCELAGILESREVTIQNAKKRVLGHADGILKINGKRYLLEIKTINSRGFTSLTAPKDAHRKQMLLYMDCLGLQEGVIIYIDKDRSVLKEYHVKYCSATMEQDIKPRIDKFFKHVRENTIPDKEGTSPTSMPCMFCPFTQVCFDTFKQAAFMKTLGAKPKTKFKIKLKGKK